MKHKKQTWWTILKLLNFWQLFLSLISVYHKPYNQPYPQNLNSIVLENKKVFGEQFLIYSTIQTVWSFLLEVLYQSKYPIIYYIVKYKRCNMKS